MKRLLMMIGAAAAVVGAMLPLSAMADAVRVYDVDDYVQEGLVAHFDGIRNAGASLAHATSGTKWTNLGSYGSAYDAALESWDSNPVNGEWTATGYDFNTTDTNTFAAIGKAIDLGTNFTIQLATTINLDEQSTGADPYRYPSYFNTYDGSNANGMWTDNKNGQGKSLVGSFDNYLGANFSGGSNKRRGISNWEGQYVTMMLEQTGQAMFFQDDELPAGSACSITTAPGAKRYTWSGAPKDKKKTPVRGVYHSVRMYTNTLDNAQLQLNRKIDEARYRNGTTKGLIPNVIVVNADGTSANEKYFVTGSETFTAPETIDESYGSFRRYGHVVETWDGSSWIGATTNLAGSCTVTPGGSTMRITWLYLRRVYDVDDYVQDGLVAHFDAIRNAGATMAHDNSATTWANLVDAANYADFTLRDGSASAGWTDTAYQFTNNCMASTISAIDLGTNFTVQIAVTGDGSAQTSGYHAWFNDNPKNDYGFWTSDDGDTITGNFKKLDNGNAEIRPTISSWGGEYVTWMLDGANSLCYTFETDTIPDGMNLTVVSTYPAARKYCWGGELTTKDVLQAFLTADYHNVRMYNRPLTDDEIKHNRVVDEARFRNDETKGLLPNVIVVGADGTSANEKYVADGSLTFTAPETVVNRKGAFRRYGNVVETWDGTAWSGAVTNDSGSCVITADAGDAAKRVTWLWSDILRSYDVDDYVQDGLVGHFDAIRNAGADAEHSLTATTWKNLVGGPDAEFQYRDGATPDSAWTDTSYFFKEDAMATTVDTFDLGTNFTVQIATTADPSAQTQSTVGDKQDASKYNCWFNDNPKNDYGFWTDRSGTSLVGNFNKLKTAPSGNVRPSVANWGGKYVTWMLDGANSLCWTFETQAIPAGTGLTVVSTKPAARKYCWGAEDTNGNGSLQAFLTGEYHSVRMYDRVLTEDEIRQNRIVDDARYRGECDVTIVNGTVGETGTNGTSSFADGYYNMGDGESWTLTAESVKVDGKTYQPHLLVETWNGSEWVRSSTAWTDRYTLSKPVSARVRLTWTWSVPRGLIILFR